MPLTTSFLKHCFYAFTQSCLHQAFKCVQQFACHGSLHTLFMSSVVVIQMWQLLIWQCKDLILANRILYFSAFQVTCQLKSVPPTMFKETYYQCDIRYIFYGSSLTPKHRLNKKTSAGPFTKIAVLTSNRKKLSECSKTSFIRFWKKFQRKCTKLENVWSNAIENLLYWTVGDINVTQSAARIVAARDADAHRAGRKRATKDMHHNFSVA